MSVALEGYADWVGTEAYNEKLGLDRAETCGATWRSSSAFLPAGSAWSATAKSKPAAPNTTRAGRALNRRVVIKVGA